MYGLECFRFVCHDILSRVYASAIILIFGGLFLRRISRILKVNLNGIRLPITNFAKQNAEPGGRIQAQVISFGMQEISPPKEAPKIDPMFSAKFQSIGYATYYLRD